MSKYCITWSCEVGTLIRFKTQQRKPIQEYSVMAYIYNKATLVKITPFESATKLQKNDYKKIQNAMKMHYKFIENSNTFPNNKWESVIF